MSVSKPNVIFVLLDGARWDRVNASNDFQEICKEGTLLNNVTTAMPYTIGSINVTFSGLYGKDNGVDAYYNVLKLKEGIKNLPVIFKKEGYFTACDLLHERILANRGFDVHQSHDEFNDDLKLKHPSFIKQCLEKASGKPLFLFLYFSKIHTVTVSDVLKKYEWNDKKFYEKKDENLKRYDNTFVEVGKYMKTFLDTLKKLQIYDNSIIIFFSDHGTGIGERFSERNYGSFTYEETIRTFHLFISKDIKKGQISEKLRDTIDIFPTILDLAKINSNLDRPGGSFAEFLLGNSNELREKDYTFSETGALHGLHPSPEKSNVFCVKTPTQKLMYLESPKQWKFFDLIDDPNELENKYGTNPEIEKKLKTILNEFINNR